MKLLRSASLLVAISIAPLICCAFSPIHTSLISKKSSLMEPITRVSVLGSRSEIEFSSSVDEVDDDDDDEVRPESASLLPGQVVSIRIGDTSLARKAWKKRRRSGSPILVPCTILGMNRELMVKYNLLNLLHRFGKPSIQEDNSKMNNQGVVLTVGAVVKLYKHRLGGDLLKHAKALGYKTIVEYLRGSFDETFFQENGVKLMRTGPKNELALASSLSIRVARESAFKAAFVQFLPGDVDRMVHSGTTFQIESDEEKYKTITSLDSAVIQPLSAAVRISQADEISNRISTGMECNAFVQSYDINGDNGSPLLICAIDPPRAQIRDQVKRRAYVRRQIASQKNDANLKSLDGETALELKDLNVGDGPYQATVVNISSRSGAAFVDLGVSRQKGKKHGGGAARALGMLRFEDIVDKEVGFSECTEEEAAVIEASLREDSISGDLKAILEEDDVTDMFTVDEEGNISSIDPDTKEITLLGSIDDELDEEDLDDDDDMFQGMTPEERLSAIGDMLAVDDSVTEVTNILGSGVPTLGVGDKVDVYIRGVFPQSGRFMVTTNSNIRDHNLADLKRKKEAEKRLSRLASKVGGEEGLQKIFDSVGDEMEGEIKAKSKSGDWYYVQPANDSLPVGIGKNEVDGSFSSGDKVHIRINGIDETRGQLSLTIIGGSQ